MSICLDGRHAKDKTLKKPATTIRRQTALTVRFGVDKPLCKRQKAVQYHCFLTRYMV